MGKTEKAKKIGLTTKIFIALIAGAIFGIILCYLVPSGHVRDDIIVEGILYVIGQGFIRLMKMLVVPLVFCSLVCGSMAIGDTKKLGTVGVRTLIFYLFTTALAITVAKIKAAGGIRTLDTALEMIGMGVSRIGSTASVSIVEELKARQRGS